jgi:hypothetical protein
MQNNPGNIRFNADRGEIPGLTGESKGFNTYASPAEGFDDMGNLLDIYYNRHGLRTVGDILNRWAPPSENDTNNYANFVSEQLGTSPDAPIDLANPETKRNLMMAMTRMEKGHDEAERLFKEAGFTNESPVSMETQQGGLPFDPTTEQAVQDQFGNLHIFSKDTSDAEIEQTIREYNVEAGNIDPDGGVFTAIGSSFTDRLAAQYNALKQSATGEGAEDALLAMRREETRGFKKLEDLVDDEGFFKNLGDGLTLVGEQLGLQANRIIGGVTGAGLVHGAGKALGFVPHPGAKALGALIGASVPYFFADNLGRQIVESPDPMKPQLHEDRAFAGAVAQTVPEVLLGSALIPWKRMIGEGVLGTVPMKQFALGRFGKVMALTAAGAGTEAWQQMIERATVPGLSLDNEEAFKEYLDAAIMGALVTGTISPISVYLGGPESETKRDDNNLESHEEEVQSDPEVLGLPAPPLQIEYQPKPDPTIHVPPGGFTGPKGIPQRKPYLELPRGGSMLPGYMTVEPYPWQVPNEYDSGFPNEYPNLPEIVYDEQGESTYKDITDLMPEPLFRNDRDAFAYLRDRGVNLKALFGTPRDPDFMSLNTVDKSKARALAETLATAERGITYEPLMGKTDENTGKVVLSRDTFGWTQDKQDLLNWGVPEEVLVFLPKETAKHLREKFNVERSFPRDELKLHRDGFVEQEPMHTLDEIQEFSLNQWDEERAQIIDQQELEQLKKDQDDLINELAREELMEEKRYELKQKYGDDEYHRYLYKKDKYANENRAFLKKYAKELGLSRGDINQAHPDEVANMIDRLPNKNTEIRKYKDKLRKRRERIPEDFNDVQPRFSKSENDPSGSMTPEGMVKKMDTEVYREMFDVTEVIDRREKAVTRVDEKTGREYDATETTEIFTGDLFRTAFDQEFFHDTFSAIRREIRRIAGPNAVKVFFPVDISEFKNQKRTRGFGGIYNPGVIYVAQNLEDYGQPMMKVAMHELFHHIWNGTDFFSPQDRAILNQAESKLLREFFPERRKNKDDQEYFREEEVYAEAFGRWVTGTLDNRKLGPVQKVFNKLKKVLEAIRNGLNGLGFRTWEDVFKAAYEANNIPTVPPGVARKGLAQGFYQQGAKRYTSENLFRASRSLADDIKGRTTPNYDYEAKDFETKAGKPNLWWHAMRSLSSLPGMAQYDQAFSYIHNIAESSERTKAEIMSTLTDMTKTYRPHGKWTPVASAAHEILMHLRTTGQLMRYDPTGRLIYERNGKTMRASPELTQAAKTITGAYKEGLKAKERALRRAIDNSNTGLDYNATPKQVAETLETAEAVLDAFTGDNNGKKLLKEQITLLRFAKAALSEFGRAKADSFAYVPQQRHGDWGMKVTDKTGKYIGFYTTPSGVFTDGPTKGDLRKVTERIRKELGPDASISDPFVMSYDTLAHKLGRTPTMEMLEVMASAIEPESQRRFRDFMEQRLDVAEARRGVKMLESDNVPGWENNWDAVWANYVSGSAHSASRFEFSPKWNRFRAEVDRKYGNTRYGNVLNREIDYQLSPELDAAKMRQFNFAWALAGNFSTGMLQLTTLATMVPAAMMTYNANPISNLSNLSKNFAKVGKIFANKPLEGSEFLTRERLSADIKDKDLVDSLMKIKHFIQGNVLEEANLDKGATAHSHAGQVMGTFSGILNKAGIFMKVTERASRLTTALSILEDFKKNPNFVERAEKSFSKNKNFQTFRRMNRQLSLEEALAAFYIKQTHAVFGKPGRGVAQRGTIAQFVFPFMTYAQQMGEFMLQLAKGEQGGRGQLGALMALSMFTMMAGFSGIPGSELWRVIWEGSNNMLGRKTTASTDLRNTVKEVANEFFGGEVPDEVLNEIARASDKGLVEMATGMAVGRRIGLPIWFEGILTTLMSPNPDLRSSLGVFGSTLRGVQDIGRGLEEGKFDPTPVLPTAFKNILKAIQYNNVGAQTVYGRQLVGPPGSQDPRALTPSEVFKKGLGWEPTSVSERREKNRYIDAIRTGEYAPIKQRYVEKISRLVTQSKRSDNSTEKKKLQREMKDVYNNLVAEMRKNSVPMTPDFWQSFHRSVQNRVARALRPERVEKQRLTKEVRRQIGQGRIDVYE